MDRVLDLLLIMVTYGDLPAGVNGFFVAVVFGISAATAFAFFVLLDVLVYLYQLSGAVGATTSIFGVRPGWKTCLLLLAGLLGAFLTGSVAYLIGIFQFKLLGALAAGLTWPMVLTQIMKMARGKDGSEEEQPPTNEEQS